MDAAPAGQRVGYLSASQFSREYSRFFGSAPTKDIAKLFGKILGCGREPNGVQRRDYSSEISFVRDRQMANRNVKLEYYAHRFDMK